MCMCVFLFIYSLSMPHYPGVILHAVDIQIRFIYRGCSGQHQPMLAVTAFPLQFCSVLENVLDPVTVNKVYEYSLLHVIKIYGFCKVEERLQVLCYQFLFACRPAPGLLAVLPE